MKTRTLHFALASLLALAGFRGATARAQTTTARLAAPTRNDAPALIADARRKRLAPLRTVGSPGGTRVVVASDAALSDYSAYRRGDDFCLRIPQAQADTTQRIVNGQGFTAARIEPTGGDVLLTFRLEAGATVRVAQNFNRLDIIFTSKTPTPSTDSSESSQAELLKLSQTESSESPHESASSQEDERLKQVLRRVEELETRIKELEAREKDATQTNAVQETSITPASGNASATADTRATQTAQAANTVAAHAGEHEDTHAADEHGERLPTGTPRLQLQGFADVNLRASNEKGQTTSFSLGQLDLFITSRLSENFSVIGELILEAGDDNTFSFEAHRLLLRYAPRDYFNLNIGRGHTAIGYYNTAYHHGSWFQTAADRPYLFTFESKGGILPLHIVGVSASGRIPRAPFGLRYVAEIGNGRSANATRDGSAQTAVDENNGKAFNLALVARPPRVPGLQTGFSVYRDRRMLLGSANIDETILATHLVYRTSHNEMLNEGILIRHAAGARVFNTPGFYTQFARRYGDAHPYFRYQYVNAPEDDPLLRPFDVGRRNIASAGLRYDVSDFAALKVQYDRTERRRKSAIDALILQLAFTF
jgi:TolA-binding protein